MQWVEVFDHFKTALDKKTIVHVWKDVTDVNTVVKQGYDVIRNVGCVARRGAAGRASGAGLQA